jgi:hypothetical protein
MIKLNICLSKIDKSRIKESGGKKYIDIIVMDSKNDRYGNDYMVVEDISKSERDAGKKGNIIGNGKNLGQKSSGGQPKSSSNVSSDDLPY